LRDEKGKREGIESMSITFQQRKKRKKDESTQPTEIYGNRKGKKKNCRLFSSLFSFPHPFTIANSTRLTAETTPILQLSARKNPRDAMPDTL